MKRTKLIMGMPITVEVVHPKRARAIDDIFDYFQAVDARYSTYRRTSEISRINRGLAQSKWSPEMRWVLDMCAQTKQATQGYFDIAHDGKLDPSGLVKGWAIQNAANRLLLDGYTNFYLEAGGDVQAHGHTAAGKPWRVGIRNPFHTNEIVKVIELTDGAVATSGAYIRGEHIYNPLDNYLPPQGVASLSVVGPTIYDADRFATAAYAMGNDGIAWVERTPGLEGYMIDADGMGTYTSGFEGYAV